MIKDKDMIGMQFGRWTVLEFDIDSKVGKKRFICKCSCDKHTIRSVSKGLLTSGGSTSCGCLTHENASKKNKKYNIYDIDSKEYGIGYLKNNETFYFDLEDYDKIKNYCWYKNNNGYIYSKTKNQKNIALHRLVMGVQDISFKDVVVDHIHGKDTRNDNRKCNLRLCKPIENTYNKGLKSDNTSGITGVYWRKRGKVWNAYIDANKKRINLGDYKNKEDAIKARKEAEKKYFGEYSYDNSRNSS